MNAPSIEYVCFNCSADLEDRYMDECPGCQVKDPRPVKVVLCCNQRLECPDFTNTCDTCGADYNWAGQRLAPRSCWGEETGETAADILQAEAEDFDGDYDY